MKTDSELVMRSDMEQSAWNNAADTFDEAWMWHRWEAVEAYATWDRNADMSFALCERTNGRPVMLLPLRHVSGRKPFPRLLGHLESTGGPAFSHDLSTRQRQRAERETRLHLVELASRTRASRIDLSLAPLAPARREPGTAGINPLAMLGGNDVSTQSWLLDLKGRSEDDLWRNLEQRVRKAVNRAERAGVVVRDVTPDDLGTFRRLHTENAARVGLTEKPADYFDAIFQRFLPVGMAIGFCAENPDGRTIAIHIFGVYKNAAIYWVVASDARARESGANDLVQWHAIKTFAEMGLDSYECGEAFPGIPEGKLRRISDFKKGFGGTLTPYYRSSLVTRPRVCAAMNLLRAFHHSERGDTD